MKGAKHPRRWHELPYPKAKLPKLCRCGHPHVVSLGDDGADAGCSQLGRDCECWEFRQR